MIDLRPWFILLTMEWHRDYLDVADNHRLPGVDLPNIGEAKEAKYRLNWWIKRTRPAHAGDDDWSPLIELQQRGNVAVVPMAVRAADSAQRHARHIEGRRRYAPTRAQERVRKYRRPMRLKQKGAVTHERDPRESRKC